GVAVALVAEDRRRDGAGGRQPGLSRVLRAGHEVGLTVGVIRPAAVAHRDVEFAVRPEGEVTPVVIELGPVHPDQHTTTGQNHTRRWVRRIDGLPFSDDILVIGSAGRNRGEESRGSRLGLRGVRVKEAPSWARPGPVKVRVGCEPGQAPPVEGTGPACAGRDDERLRTRHPARRMRAWYLRRAGPARARIPSEL